MDTDFKLTFIKQIALILVGALVVNCGGGGGLGGGGNSVTYRTIDQPSFNSGSTNLTENSNTGSYTASDYEAADFGSYSYSISAETKLYGSFGSASKSGNFSVPTGHMTDTGATTAWSNGWTGQNTSIHIIDDHNTKDTTISLGTFTVDRTGSSNWNGATSNHRVTYDPQITVSHGWLVSGIAGGDKATESWDVTLDRKSQTTLNCTSSGSGCMSYYHDYYGNAYVSWDGFSDLTSSNQSIVFAPGVAKDATVLNSNVSQNLSYSDWVDYLSGHIRNSSNYDAVNLSWGVKNISALGYTYDEIRAGSSDFSDYNNTKSVFVVSAGNDGAPCTESSFTNCNLLAVDLVLDSSLGDQVIVAGALNNAGTSIATYSNRAGVMKDRFLMANGDTGYDTPAGVDVVGTSFAAPRITGAAALLKSKFQNLTGAQAADILLLSADKDIDDNGSDDFSGISDIYGHGELDTAAALSPIGNLYSY